MCDNTSGKFASGAHLQQLKRDWESVARYSVLRRDFNYRTYATTSTIKHTGLPYAEALAAREALEAEIAKEPGYRPNVMGRSLGLLQLERPDETFLQYKELRYGR